MAGSMTLFQHTLKIMVIIIVYFLKGAERKLISYEMEFIHIT